MAFNERSPERQKIQEHSVTFAMYPIELSHFMSEIERTWPTVPEDHWIEIDNTCGIVISLVRYETPEELAARLARNAAYKAKVEKRASDSWERQKRKFARARK